MDANLETVLPGVHQRFAHSDEKFDEMRREVRSSFQSLHEDMLLLAGGIDELRDDAEDSKRAMATTCLQIAGSLLGKKDLVMEALQKGGGDSDDLGQGVSPSGTPMKPCSEKPPSPTKGPLEEDGIGVQMVPKHHNLRGIWDEWHGLGSFEGVPMEGGLEAMEATFKSKWRKHLDGQHFSRTRRVVLGIREYTASEGVDKATAIEALEAIFKESGRSVANMVVKLQELGHLKKKAKRGRHQTTATQ